MSLNSLINERLYAKKQVIRTKYSKLRDDATAAYVKEHEADMRKCKEALQAIITKAVAVGIVLSVDYNYYTKKGNAGASVITDCQELKDAHARITKDETKETEKFVSLDEKAQLSALLPAKERRDEMAAILAEIAKF